MNAKPRLKSTAQRPYRAASREDAGKKPSHRHLARQHGRIFLPGEPVPESGIYEVVHDHAHREAHEAVMHRGDPFPVCDECDIRVRFKLVRTAPYIFDDEDFQEQEPE